MTSGSWNIEIGVHDRAGPTGLSFNVPNGTASLTGGTLNINYLSGLHARLNEGYAFCKSSDGVTLNAGAVTIAGNAGWSLITDLTTDGANPVEIHRTGGWVGAVPEPCDDCVGRIVRVGAAGLANGPDA